MSSSRRVTKSLLPWSKEAEARLAPSRCSGRSSSQPRRCAIASTAPYFHNGAFATLESVVDFYDRGGGKGLGLAVPNADPDVIPLKLSVEERRVLLLFLRRTLTEREPPKLR